MKKFKYLLVFCLLYSAAVTRAQTHVTSPMTGTPAPGLYYNEKNIAVNPNFTFTPASGQSLQLYIITTGTYLDLGFVQQENVRVPGVTNDSLLNALNDVQKQTTRSYLDGTGRTVQTIGLKASPLQNDLIQPFAYDNLGRQTISYLPYAGQSTDTSGRYRPIAIQADQPGFYSNTSQFLVATDASPFTQQVFENSPLQRMLKAGTVGTGFQPVAGQHFKTVNYRFNATADGNIPIWNADGTFTSGNYYAANTLSVTDAIDEDNTETLGFTDQAGHMILKRQILASGNLDTYYIYNWAGMLSYIVPPKAVAIMAGTYTLSATGVNKLIFHMVYDTMGRLTEKTVPSKGRMNIVYDPLNRPVLMQDSNMHAANKWNYIKYDVKGRAISQGIYVDATHTTRSAMQTYVSGLNYSTAWFESRSHLDNTTGYYTNTIFPTTGTTPLAYAYFDDYDLQQTGSANYTYGSQGLPNEETPTTAYIKGVPTMVWKTTVGAGLSGVWLLKVTFYDKRGNAIQTQSNNHVNYTGSATVTDTATTVPDFVGVPQVTMVTKKTSVSITTKVQTNFTYDHMYRVTAIDQYYNGSATVKHVAAYSYNELGQLVKKSLGYNPGTSAWIQNADMRYNIRGQLLTINNSKLANDGGVTSGDSNDLFGIQMLYDKADGNLGNTPYYNGKLSAVKWMSKDASGTSSYERAFRYYYDQLNRDTGAIYAERTTASTSPFTTTNGWNENRITYDANGNLLTLFRDSTSQGSGRHTPIDNLAYTYDTNNPNQLQKVTDGTGTAYTNSGFRNRTGSTSSYTYDNNGNLTNEPYKGISAIAYNVLNRTDKITFTVSANRYIDYTYDAGGTLIRKRQYDNVGGVKTLLNTTDYIDGFVYTTVSGSQTLQYFAMPEGRVLNSAGTLTQEYTLTDQQGNVRITFDNSGTGGTAKVRQENSYYAFGLVMPGSVVTTPSNPNKHLYNGGSEWQNDYGNLPDYYQTFNRNYDAALGRWIGVDPVAEGAESMSSYQYAGNNPILFNDPLGDKNKLPPPEFHFTDYSQWNTYHHHDVVTGDQILGIAQNNPYGGAGGGLYTSIMSLGEDVLEGIQGTDVSEVDFSQNEFRAAISVENMVSKGATAELNINSDGSFIIDINFMNPSTEGGVAGGDPFGYAGNLFHVPGANLPKIDPANKQIGATCEFCSVAAASGFYGKKVDGLALLDKFSIDGQIISLEQETSILNGGLPTSLERSFFNQFLIGIYDTDVASAIAKGYPVLGSYNTGPHSGHEVLITGFSYFTDGPNAGFNYAFYNPATGGYGYKPPSAFNNDTYVVIGVK